MNAVILDGWHGGSIVRVPGRLPTLSMIKRKSTTICDCNPCEPGERIDNKAETIDYALAGEGADGTLLYSLKGDLFDPLTSGRTWIQKSPDGREKSPVYYCGDERAW